MQRMVTISVLILGVVSAAMPALAGSAEEAAEKFAAGKALLAQADFDGALKAFKKAAKKDAKNQEYAQEYAMLRQVVGMRQERRQGAGRREVAEDRWSALRTFYYDHNLYSEALPLDQERHRRHPSAESAVLLAETQLTLGMHSETVEMLGTLTTEQTSPRAAVLGGVALARLGRIDEARELADESRQGTDDAGPRYFFDLACLHALTGNSPSALEALTRAFELTPPSLIDGFRADVKECNDFAALLANSDFAKVLETPSKVKESACSGGTACGKCPMRSKCGSKDQKDHK